MRLPAPLSYSGPPSRFEAFRPDTREDSHGPSTRNSFFLSYGRMFLSPTRRRTVATVASHDGRETPVARLRRMNERTRKVLDQALELPSAERCELARKLLESLQQSAPADVESAWAVVIARRAQEVLDGSAATRDHDTGLDEIEARARARAAARLRISPHRDHPFRRMVTTCFAASCPSISPS